jgi:hypothetical protein
MSKLKVGDFVFDVDTRRIGFVVRTENIRELDVPPAVAAAHDPDYAASLVLVKFEGYTKSVIVSDRSLEMIEEYDEEGLGVESSEKAEDSE